jgi:hypothetical protein
MIVPPLAFAGVGSIAVAAQLAESAADRYGSPRSALSPRHDPSPRIAVFTPLEMAAIIACQNA